MVKVLYRLSYKFLKTKYLELDNNIAVQVDDYLFNLNYPGTDFKYDKGVVSSAFYVIRNKTTEKMIISWKFSSLHNETRVEERVKTAYVFGSQELALKQIKKLPERLQSDYEIVEIIVLNEEEFLTSKNPKIEIKQK